MRLVVGCLLMLQGVLFAENETVTLDGELGSVRYVYEDEQLLRIERVSALDEVIYTHSYTYDEEGEVVSEGLIGDVGDVTYVYDINESPYLFEIWEYDTEGVLLDYTGEASIKEYLFVHVDGLDLDDLDESYDFDGQGNLTRWDNIYFTYDDQNRFTEISQEELVIGFVYDRAERRIVKSVNEEVVSCIFFGNNDIEVIDEEGNVTELRLPSISGPRDILRPVAIEKDDATYVPIHDVQGNLMKLMDIDTKEVVSLALIEPFGTALSDEVDLVYAGNKYYASSTGEWLPIDPEEDQYYMDDSFLYADPDGRTTGQAQEYYDQSLLALLAGVQHSFSGGTTVENARLVIYETPEATEDWLNNASP